MRNFRGLGLLLVMASLAPVANAQVSDNELDKDLNQVTFPSEDAAPKAALTTAQEAGRESIDRDEPNLATERRLYRIFKNMKPVNSTKWSEMVGSRKEDVYVVQKGDTLWDISKTLFGDGFFWSKLWAENEGVENPHRISTGMGIRFLAGTETVAPKVEVVSAKAVQAIRRNEMRELHGVAPVYREQALKDITPEELAERNSIEVDELVPSPEMPPPKPESAVLKDLPNSFERKVVKEFLNYDRTGLDVGKRPSYANPAKIIPVSYLADQTPTGIGKLTEIETQETTASVGQNVFITLRQPASIGARFSVLYPQAKIKDPVRGEIGPIVEIGGLIEVFEVVDALKHTYRAQVVTGVNPIRLGSVISIDPLPVVSFSRRGTRLNIDLRVIGGEGDENRSLIGENSIVYLDGGKKNGLTAGDILAVRSNRAVRRKNSEFSTWSRPIALLKVAKVENSVATALIMQATEEVMPGDRTGGVLPETSRALHNETGTEEQE